MAIPTVTITGTLLSPEGVGVASGTIEAEISQPISILDGAVSQRVASSGYIVLAAGGALPAAGAPDAFKLAPNAAGTPSGTYYNVKVSVTTIDGARKRWTERWQLASTPSPIDIGAVPRLDAVPGVVVSTQWNAYDLLLFAPGVPTADLLLARVVAPRQITLPVNLAGSRGSVGTNPSAIATITAKKNGVAVGTISISTAGVFAFTAASAVSLVAGDVLSLHAQAAPADAVLADISITLVGSL